MMSMPAADITVSEETETPMTGQMSSEAITSRTRIWTTIRIHSSLLYLLAPIWSKSISIIKLFNCIDI